MRRTSLYVKLHCAMIAAWLIRLALPLVLAFLVVSCGGGGDSSDAPGTPADVGGTPSQPSDPLTAAAADLAERFDRDLEEIEFVSMSAKQWPDACLGLPEPGEACDQVVTPGYEVKFRLEGEVYTYRTDMVDNIRLAGDVTPDASPSPLADDTSAPDETIPPVIVAREAMAADLDVSPEEVEVLRVAEMEWPDTCLGLPEPGEACAQVMTPGYEVVLGLDGETYTYHTDRGANIRRADSGADAD